MPSNPESLQPGESNFSHQELAQELMQSSPEAASRTEYRVLADNDLRTRYVGYTDELIDQLEKNQTDTAIFLDKSARPVAWLTHELWDVFAPNSPEPAIKFANIDREQWREHVGSMETGKIDVENLRGTELDQLRQLYRDPNAPDKSLFEGQKIMIVDEVKTSGDTLETALQLFEKAFPGAEFRGHWWMRPAIKGGRTKQVPI